MFPSYRFAIIFIIKFEDGKILLVKENNGTWSLPGGWVDVDVSVHDNIIKEVKEESGLDVTVDTVIAIQDREKHNQPVYAWKVCKVFALCSVVVFFHTFLFPSFLNSF